MLFHHTHTPGEMIDHLDSDITILSNFFSQLVIQVVGNIILLLGVLVLLFRVDWLVGLALGIFIAVTVFAIQRMRSLAVPRWLAARQAAAESYGFIERMEKLLLDAPAGTLVQYSPLALHGPLPELPFVEKTEEHRLLVVEGTGLSYCYPSTSHGVHDVNVCLPRGSFTAITGRIGSGKTTLLRVLLGLLSKDASEISWNGQHVVDPAAFFVPPHSAYTAQVLLLFSETLKENILLGLPAPKRLPLIFCRKGNETIENCFIPFPAKNE